MNPLNSQWVRPKICEKITNIFLGHTSCQRSPMPYAALTHRLICLRMCLRMKRFDIRSKVAEYLSAFVTNLERSQVILQLLTNIGQFRKRLLAFSECCECCHPPSIFVSIRKPFITLVRHSEAFATFVRHLQGVFNVRRFPFLVNVLPLVNSRKQWAQRHIHSVFIPIAASSSNIRIIRKKMARQWQRW